MSAAGEESDVVLAQCHEVRGGEPSEYVVMAACLTPRVPLRTQPITGGCGRPMTQTSWSSFLIKI